MLVFICTYFLALTCFLVQMIICGVKTWEMSAFHTHTTTIGKYWARLSAFLEPIMGTNAFLSHLRPQDFLIKQCEKIITSVPSSQREKTQDKNGPIIPTPLQPYPMPMQFSTLKPVLNVSLNLRDQAKWSKFATITPICLQNEDFVTYTCFTCGKCGTCEDPQTQTTLWQIKITHS